MDFESILEEILLGRGQGNLKLKPKQKEALQRSRLFKNCRSNCRITETISFFAVGYQVSFVSNNLLTWCYIKH